MHRKGIILIENVVALTLAGILITATVFSFASGKIYAAAGRHRYHAANIVREEMEQIVQAGIANGATSPADETVIIDAKDTSTPSDDLLGTMSVTYNPNPAGATVVVDVEVSWTEPMWTDKSMSENIALYLVTE